MPSRGEARGFDPALATAAVAVVALGHQQLGQEPAVGHLIADRGVGELGELAAHRGQPQVAAGGIDGGISSLFGQAAVTGDAHGGAP